MKFQDICLYETVKVAVSARVMSSNIRWRRIWIRKAPCKVPHFKSMFQKNDPDMSYKGNFDWDVGNLFFRSSDSTFDTAGK